MRKIETVIFDVGGVFTMSPFSSFDEIGVSKGARPGQVYEIMFGSYAEDGDHPWHRLERGEISLEDCRSEILQRSRSDFGIELDIYELFEAMPRDGGIRHQLVERVGRLREEGYRTAIITNNVKEFSAGWRSLMPVDELFELVIDSCEVGMRKPNPEIFRETLWRLGDPEPRSALFLDDFQANIDAAAAVGIRGLLVGEEIADAIAKMDEILAENAPHD